MWLRSARWKFIDAPRPELYALDADPGETVDRLAEHRDVADSLRERLRAARAVDAPIKVLFGGVPAAALDYAGGAPGFAGLCQVNVTIPLNSPLGPSVPVAVSTSNAHTELVEIPISR